MSNMKWKTGEVCRVGDLVLIDGKTLEVTGLGRTRVFMMEPGQPHHEPSFIARLCILLHRIGEAEDRDRKKYEYEEGEPTFGGMNRTDAGWLLCGKTDTWHVWRRFRIPEAPAKPPFDPSFFAAIDPPPAKPPFEAVVWPVEREASGICYVIADGQRILAYAGNGYGGFTIAGFFEDWKDVETFAEKYRQTGSAGCGYLASPMFFGNPAKCCVATRRNK